MLSYDLDHCNTESERSEKISLFFPSGGVYKMSNNQEEGKGEEYLTFEEALKIIPPPTTHEKKESTKITILKPMTINDYKSSNLSMKAAAPYQNPSSLSSSPFQSMSSSIASPRNVSTQSSPLKYINSPASSLAESILQIQRTRSIVPYSPDINADVDEKKVQLEMQKDRFKSTFPPVTITFEDITYTIPAKKKWSCVGEKCQPTQILKSINGIMKPGQLWALMGPSGSGKTTMLDILAHRLPANRVGGKVMFNGQILSRKLTGKLCGYVMQEDALLENLTVRETFTSMLHLRAGKMSSDETKYRVNTLIQALGLNSCAETKIGSALRRGLSGGEKKRVAIGCELLNQPSVLFLDEPTSGLDSATALQICQLLAKVAHQMNRTVVCTIHQPSSRLFKLFDKIILLSAGQCIYAGNTKDASNYFTSIGYPVEEHTNPSDFFLDLVNQANRRQVIRDKKAHPLLAHYFSNTTLPTMPESNHQYNYKAVEKDKKVASLSAAKDRIRYLKECFERSNIHAQLEESIQQELRQRLLIDEPTLLEIATKEEASSKKRNGPLSRFKILAWRNFTDRRQSPMYLMLCFVQSIIIAVMVSFFYWRVGDDQKAVNNRQGVLYFIALQQLMSGIMCAVGGFQNERLVVTREYLSGVWSVPSYYLAKFVSDLPLYVISPILFSMISYPLIQLHMQWNRYFIHAVCMVIMALVSTSLGNFISVLSPNYEVANIGVPLTLAFSMLFGGLLINPNHIPVYLKWIAKVDVIKYCFDILIYNDFNKLSFSCTQKEFIEAGGRCPFENGQQVLEQVLSFDLKTFHLGFSFAVLIILWLGFHFLSMCALAGTLRGWRWKS